MMTANRSSFKLSMIALALAMPAAFAIPMLGQEAREAPAQSTGYVDDWSFHHLVFSNPGTREEAVKAGKLDRWLKITGDRRYQIQLRRRSGTRPAVAEAADAKKPKLKKDWSENLGSAAPKATQTGLFSGTTTANLTQTVTITNGSNALVLTMSGHEGTITVNSTPHAGDTVTIGTTVYQFESASSSCSGSDRCVDISGTSASATNLISAIGGTCFNTCSGNDPDVLALAGSSGVIDVINMTTGTISPWMASTSRLSVSPSSFTQTVTNTCSSSTAGTFIINSNTAALASNLAAAITACNSAHSAVGVTAVQDGTNHSQVDISAAAGGAAGNSITLTESVNNFTWNGTSLSGGATPMVQPNAYPAKFSFSTTSASCSNDFVIYPTGAQGASGEANVIAYNKLYSGSTGTGGCGTSGVPAVYWAYNTGAGEAVTTSPILSFDGTQVAFIQSNGTTASLVLLKWAQNSAESMTAPDTLTSQLSASAYRTCSTTPCMYTMQFSGNYNDTFSSPFYDYPSDALYVGDDSGSLHRFTGVFNGTPTEAGSPWPVSLGSSKLSSPVYDPNWNADGQAFVGDLGGGLHCVTSTGTICGTTSISGQIADAPLINSSANYLLAFVNSSTRNTVYGYGEQFFPTSPGIVGVGTGATGYYLYSGTYDNLYYESTNATGNMYVVGNTGATTGATLYRVGLTGGFLNGAVTSTVTGLTPNGAYPWPSPVSEFCNNGANVCALQTASNCTLNSTTTITCGTADFTSSDVGASVTGTDIPSGATISTVSSTTKIIISTPASGSTSGVSLTVGATSSGTDYVFFSVNRGTPSGCSSSAGNGCILAYNVSYPSVSEAGSGLPVTTPGTNGCWATGGLVIDNSATTTGASEIYSVNLNGNAAGSGSTQTSANCSTAATPATLVGVQTSQSNP